MNRKRAVTAFMIVTCLGSILSMMGSAVALGMGLGESLYNTLSTSSVVLFVLCIVALSLHPDSFKAKRNQSETESNSSLLQIQGT